MVTHAQERFDVDIPVFTLTEPYSTVH
jgi:hypothetical protein